MASTPAGSNALILEILDRTNYKYWRSRLKAYLLAEDLWEAVEAIVEPTIFKDDQVNYKAWTKKNAKALYAIQNSCGRELFSFICEIETAKDAWEVLEQECKVVQGYDANNDDHLVRYKWFIQSVSNGDWDEAKKCLGEVDIRSVVVLRALDKDGNIALQVAAKEGHAHIVKELVHLMTQNDLKTKNADGHTALHLAAGKGHVHVVKELPVQLMGEVKDKDGDTALHIAVRERKVDIVKELVLLMRQEDLKIENDAGYTALHLAVINKVNMLMVKEFVRKEEGENNIGEDDSEDYIPFATYAMNGDWDKANECLRVLNNPYGAVTAVDRRNQCRDTTLHVAVRKGHLNVTKGLVSLLKTREGTARDFRSFGREVRVGDTEENLMKSAKFMVQEYEKTLDSCLVIQNALGYTAFHLAVLQGNVDIVKVLMPLMSIEGLAVKCANGDTALNSAILKGHVDIAESLVEWRREFVHSRECLEGKNNNGANALHLAAKEKRVHIFKSLMGLMRPQALEEKDGQGMTALNLAIQCFKDGDALVMARYMNQLNNKVFSIPSAPEDEIPVVTALRYSKWESTAFIAFHTPPEALKGPNGSHLLCLCLNASKTISLAWYLLRRDPKLAFTLTKSHDKITPMLKLARMDFAFLSGTRLTRWQRWLYDCIPTQDNIHDRIHGISINVTEPEDHISAFISSGIPTQDNIHDRIHGISINVTEPEEPEDHSNKSAFISSVMNLYIRFAKSLHIFRGIRCLYEMKSTHEWIFHFLHCMGKATSQNNLTPDELDTVQKSIFKAIERGHYEFVTQLCKANPKLLLDIRDEKRRTIFHFAIENRQKEVYSLIYGLEEEERNEIVTNIVNPGCMLHSAANLSSLPQFDRIQDASLQMQRELQWFKEVESVVPLEMHEIQNSDGLTARELFTRNHKNLIEDAENSTKGTATSCTVVGALIVTMMFAAAFTVPGGNNDNTGLPLLLDKRLFKVFIVSDTISLVSSTTSVITFLGILTSRYAEDDFLKSLPTKMMIGLFALFFSIVTLMIAFSCALVIMLDGEAWIVIPSILFASVPAISFVWLLFPLLGKIFMSTYGPGIFDKRNKVKS